MIVIPAVDIFENKVVRLLKGDFNQIKIYSESALEQAKIFEQNGFEWIHIVDLLGSKNGNINVIDLINQIKSETKLKIEFGGGIRNLENAEKLISLGVNKLIIGSMSIIDKNEFENIVNRIGEEKIIVAADVSDEKISIKGWTQLTSVSLYEHINYCISLGIDTFLCTDISKDGMLSGTNLDLYKKIMNQYSKINLIASGGIKDLEDVKKVNELNVYGVVVGKAIYENKINLKELAEVGK